MVSVHLVSGFICQVDRFFGVLSPHDDGSKTYYIGQIAGAKRRFTPEEVKGIAADWMGQ